MKVQEQDVYHGIALAQLVKYSSFKAINCIGSKYGLYFLNLDRCLFIKYCGYGNEPWQFTFSSAEMACIGAQTERSTLRRARLRQDDGVSVEPQGDQGRRGPRYRRHAVD
ncbi:MAG: hypothetical protein M3083_00920 [Actinomycetota bacterium]|nr:hypothetical protein [Actinomycetota bacterium]MDQ6946400.1 hypothetical protein [Actinomycetota bacterium]